MNNYRNITFWESLRRQERLDEFLELVDTYFLAHRAKQVKRASEARTSLNLMLIDVKKILYAANVRPVIRWTPPPMVGGPSQNIDLVENLFFLDRYSLSPAQVSDVVLRAQGVYKSNHFRSFLRTFNPLWWAGEFQLVSKTPLCSLALLVSTSARQRRASGTPSAASRCSPHPPCLLILSYLELLDEFLKVIEGLVD